MYIMTKPPAVKPVSTSTTALVPVRVVDAHSLLHRKASKAVRAVEGADILDGLATLRNLTLRLVAMALGVSVSSLVLARRLTPEQRDAVRQDKRPLVLPTKPKVLPAPAATAQEKLQEVVREVGLQTTCDMLSELDAIYQLQDAGLEVA